MPDRPFCADDPAAITFDRWLARFKALGLELGDADRLLVGLLASREANLADLRRRLAGEGHPEMRLKVGQHERAAAADFARTLELCERLLGARIGDEAPSAVSLPPNVVRFRSGSADARARQRILAALAAGPLTRLELRRRAPGDASAFLRGLKALVGEGAVVVRGVGRRGDPKRYQRAAGGAA